MEAASNKQGCWQRDPKNCRLIFVCSGEYKTTQQVPASGPTTLARWDPTKAVQPVTPPNASAGPISLAGSWRIRVWGFPPPAQMALIRQMGTATVTRTEGIEVLEAEPALLALNGPPSRLCGTYTNVKEKETRNVCLTQSSSANGLTVYTLELPNLEQKCTVVTNGVILKGKCITNDGYSGEIWTGERGK